MDFRSAALVTSFTKHSLNHYSLKVTKFHGDSVKNESARTEKLQGVPNSEYPRFSVTKCASFRRWVVRIEKVRECNEC